MSEIKCTISNCEYWGTNSICQSPSILVAAGPPESQEEMMAQMSSELQDTPVQEDIQTHCHTFEQRL